MALLPRARHPAPRAHPAGSPALHRHRPPHRSHPIAGRRGVSLRGSLFGVGAVREPPEGHAIPNVPPNPTTTAHCAIAAPALTLVASVIHTNHCRRSREGGNLASLPPVWDVRAVREPPERHAIPTYPPTQRQLPIAHRRDSPYIDCIRHSRAERSSLPRRRAGPFSLEGRRLG